MPDWREEYQRKLVSAWDAAQVVKSGDRIAITIGSYPELVGNAIAARKGELEHLQLVLNSPGPYDWFDDEEFERTYNVILENFGARRIGGDRNLMEARRVDYAPTLFSVINRPYHEGWTDERWRIDVFVTVVSPPDEHGYVSFGASMWNKKTYVRRARIAIAEVDANQIRTYGDNFIHISEFDYFVEHTVDPEERRQRMGLRGQQREIEPAVLQIAQHVKPLIRHGDTIQLGTGTASGAMARAGVFDDLEDLGWHSEITPAGIVDLVKRGNITGKRKTLHRGKHVATALPGQGADAQYVHMNPAWEAYDVEYTNSITTIAAHENMVAINNALEVDLTGQIVSEALGTRVFNGIGGQPEFHIGAFLSKGGRAITVLPSTTSDGKSRIVPIIRDTFVTVPRTFADWIVTEYGAVRLQGLSQRERAEALISIAHPDHREELRYHARKMFWP